MTPRPSALASWSPEQIALGRRWVKAWKDAAPELERIRHEELRRLDAYAAIALLCIIIRQSGTIDWTYVRAQLAPLAELKKAPEILDQLDRRRAELDR